MRKLVILQYVGDQTFKQAESQELARAHLQEGNDGANGGGSEYAASFVLPRSDSYHSLYVALNLGPSSTPSLSRKSSFVTVTRLNSF